MNEEKNIKQYLKKGSEDNILGHIDRIPTLACF
jgi:hypothetical protein